ncbi:MAG: hypothetical protein L3J63_11130, partial [Geopsychrobacter sp.]|nr:hypothetical protein [Geopsychrobacter sp.]
KRVDYGKVKIENQGKAEGIIRRDETIPREPLNINDRVRAIIYEVREETRGPQIFLSRSHPEFMAKLCGAIEEPNNSENKPVTGNKAPTSNMGL